MITVITIVIVAAATGLIFLLRKSTERLPFKLLKNSLLDRTLKFQLAQLLLAFLVLGIIYLKDPENLLTFLGFGNPNALINPVPWLGITGKESWLEIAGSIGFFITLGTAIFMFFQLRRTGSTFKDVFLVLPWAVLFSVTNAFSEEAIFRVGLISPLIDQISIPAILIISGVMFGLPHYFGQPSGLIGVLMAGFLGWFLALSLIETEGVFIAWLIHFVQDVVIITTFLLINRMKKVEATSATPG